MKKTSIHIAIVFALFCSKATFAQTAQQLSDNKVTGTTEQLLARVAIDALNTEYFYRIDHGDAEKVADLFVADGVLNGMAGREAIRKFYAARTKTRTTRHVSTNLRLVFENENRVSGTRTLSYYMGEGPGPHAAVATGIAEYSEIYERGTDGQWRYVFRKITPVFGKQ
jgi:ketosteroid isomerase-like protein